MTVEVLLDRNASYDELERAAADLFTALAGVVQASGLPLDPPGTVEDRQACLSGTGEIACPPQLAAWTSPHQATPLPTGLAISPADAASCTRDPIRTAVLLRGVDAALRDALDRFGAIEVVYAGTGPLAPLVIPLLPRFANAPVKFTFIDIHAEAVNATRLLAAGSAAAIDFVTADAATYQHPSPLHLVITETMQRALTREPQVAIVRNLARQLAPGGILVPESVRVELVVDDRSFPLLDLRIDTADLDNTVRIEMPERRSTPVYQTTITAYRDHVIGPCQSGLTHPEIAWELMTLPAGTAVDIHYQIGPAPRFVHTLK